MASTIQILPPLGIARGYDVSDWFADGHTMDDLLRVGTAPLREQSDAGPLLTPINWSSFWAGKKSEPEWLIPFLVPKGRQVALWSTAKAGKSLLALDGVAALACGDNIFGQDPKEKVNVVYFDQEMTADDLRERLEGLGYAPDSDLDCLHYYQLTDLPPLDTDYGGEVVESIVKATNAQLVVVDTMARVVSGDEDKADTYRGFYRCTGRRLKALGCALLRLDHSGKNELAGQRGSSAKVDDVDVVLHLTVKTDAGGLEPEEVILRRTHSRISWVPPEVVFTRDGRVGDYGHAIEHKVVRFGNIRSVDELLKRMMADLPDPQRSFAWAYQQYQGNSSSCREAWKQYRTWRATGSQATFSV